ncbi:MAG: peptidoglycan DD-metalloendopeptidase family protein [Eubacterium sp.]|nr:peptidoglycan DD-metalloendopeptidase family protein [Eubacterium sp.]
MKKTRLSSLCFLVFAFVLTAGITSVAAKEINGGNTHIYVGDTASPGDSVDTEAPTQEQATQDKKKKKKTTESSTNSTEQVTVYIPEVPDINAAEITAITDEYSKTMQEKVALQEKLNLLMENQNDFIKRLHDLDDMIIEYQQKIDDIDEKTRKAQDNLVLLQENIDQAEEAHQEQYDRLKEHIREEYENGTYTYLDALFNAVDYTDVVNKTEYIQAVDTYNNTILGQISDEKRRLEDKKAMLEMLNDSMAVLQQAYADEQDSLEILSKEKEKQINEFQSSIDTAKTEMAEIEAVEAEMNSKIAAIEAKYNVSITVSGFSTNVVYTGEDFLWPAPSNTTISSYYGPRVAPTAGATTFHRGIDIPCPMGTGIIAVASGTVIYTGYLGNGGNCVIVDHGSGISTCYFHLSAFGCKVGDSVAAGQTICFSGNTGVSTGPHLHFAVRENGEYVNPLKYYKNIKDRSKVANTEGGSED